MKPTAATKEHMPFKGHRTVAVWWEDDERHAALVALRKQIRAA